ncbi:MAG: IS1634 family transposase [Dethiobacter sp.]|nr:IS1634 family transposase [Dethiobacter sp.]
MGTIVPKKKKNQVYYYYVESARVNGKPRVVFQKYLGRAERIAQAFEEASLLDAPKHSIVHEFGAVCSLYELASQLGIIDLIDRHCPKREQGLSVGQYMLLAAINRAVEPVSKTKIADWYDKTVLYHLLPAQKSWLSSQRFWDNMALVSETAVEKIEDELSAFIVKTFGIDTDCLIYDTTNFFTFVDTRTKSQLPQRGRCNSKSTDLKIVGLAMMVSPDFNVPLFHETYSGNLHDTQQFFKVVDKLKKRLNTVASSPGKITLVFDKGNNSLDNMDKIFEQNKECLHVVGSLKFCEHKELLDIAKKDFSRVWEYQEDGVTAYRLKKIVYKREMTLIITHNPALLEGQLQGISDNIKKCIGRLNELQQRLLKRQDGEITRGKRPTAESVGKNLRDILSVDHMKDIFEITLTEQNGHIVLDAGLSMEKLEYIKERYLGKTLLFTDHHDWPTGKIISAYRSMHHIESSFRQMKDTTFLGFRPIYHWTDQKIKVHAFYCVLAFRLCCLLKRILHKNDMTMSVNRMLSLLSEIKQVITIYPKKGESKKDRESYSISKLSPEQKKMAEILNILKYQRIG